MTDEIASFFNALLLALGGSTDNFSVGFALGIKNTQMSMKFNLFISTVNAIGAYFAGLFGYYAKEMLSGSDESIGQYVSLIAGIAFYYLALSELFSDGSGTSSKSGGRVHLKDAIDVAIPMTLNNLASGIAGGSVGIPPRMSFILAFICSFLLMDTGHRIAKKCRIEWIVQKASVISFIIFGFLGTFQILNYLGIYS